MHTNMEALLSTESKNGPVANPFGYREVTNCINT